MSESESRHEPVSDSTPLTEDAPRVEEGEGTEVQDVPKQGEEARTNEPQPGQGGEAGDDAGN